jgi:hypothetical protein
MSFVEAVSSDMTPLLDNHATPAKQRRGTLCNDTTGGAGTNDQQVCLIHGCPIML